MKTLCRWARRLEIKKALQVFLFAIIFMLMLPRAGSESPGYMLIGELIKRSTSVPWISIGVNIAVLLILLKCLHSKKPDTNFRKLVRDVLGGNIGTVFGLTVLIIELVLIGWITDYLREGFYWAAFSSTLIFLNVLILFMLMTSEPSPSRRRGKPIPQKKKVLIFALSIKTRRGNESPEGFEQKILREYEEEIRKLIDYYILRTGTQKPKWSNWELPIRSIAHHLDELEKILVLTSKTTGNQIGSGELFKRIFKRHVKSAVKRAAKRNVSIIEIGPVDFNDYDEIFDAIKNALKKVFQEGYTDRDLSFMISGGTSAVTAALIISAVRDGRQVEYFTQEGDRSEHISIDVNIFHVRRILGGDID